MKSAKSVLSLVAVMLISACSEGTSSDSAVGQEAEPAARSVDSEAISATLERLNLEKIPLGAQTFEASNWLCLTRRNLICEGAGHIVFTDQDSGSAYFEFKVDGTYGLSYGYTLDFELIDGMLCYPDQDFAVEANGNYDIELARRNIADVLFPEGLMACDVISETSDGGAAITTIRENGIVAGPPGDVELLEEKPRLH